MSVKFGLDDYAMLITKGFFGMAMNADAPGASDAYYRLKGRVYRSDTIQSIGVRRRHEYKWETINGLPDPKQVAEIAMDHLMGKPNLTGYLIMMDEDGNPIKPEYVE